MHDRMGILMYLWAPIYILPPTVMIARPHKGQGRAEDLMQERQVPL